MSNQCYRAKKIVEMNSRNHKKEEGSSDNGVVRQLSRTKSTTCPPSTFVNELIAMPAVVSNQYLAASTEPNPRDEQIPDPIIESYEPNAATTFDRNQDLSEPCQGNEYISLQPIAELYQTDDAPTVYQDQSETNSQCDEHSLDPERIINSKAGCVANVPISDLTEPVPAPTVDGNQALSSLGAGGEIKEQILQEEYNMNVLKIEPQSSFTDRTRAVSVDKKCKNRKREPEKSKKKIRKNV